MSCVIFLQLISVRILNSVIHAHDMFAPDIDTWTMAGSLQLILENWSDHVFFKINTHYLFTNKVVIIEINTK